MKLSNETFTKTSAWIKRNARPLEAARWAYLFEGGSRDDVIHYLSAFQNKDGGFGHGLEPDFWLPDSSPMATWAAGQILMEIHADANDEIVRSMLSYLAGALQKESGMWLSVLPENNHYPHAPWWHWEEGVQEEWMFNPSAELAGFLLHWSAAESNHEQLGWSVIEKAIDRLMTAENMDPHELSNYQHLYKVLALHETAFNQTISYSLSEIENKITALVMRCVDRDVSAWSSGYKPLPLDFVESPDDPLCEQLGDLIDHHLTFLKEQLSADGTWNISWQWGSYPETFAVAKQQWQGILAVDRYKILQSFGCLESRKGR